MLMSDITLKSYTHISYHNEELKPLTRYQFDKIRDKARLKQSIPTLVTILLPELERLLPTLHMASVYAFFNEFPRAHQIAICNLTHLKIILSESSQEHYGNNDTITIREDVRSSIESSIFTKSLGLKHIIKLIQKISSEIGAIEQQIELIMNELNSLITTFSSINLRMGAMILAKNENHDTYGTLFLMLLNLFADRILLFHLI